MAITTVRDGIAEAARTLQTQAVEDDALQAMASGDDYEFTVRFRRDKRGVTVAMSGMETGRAKSYGRLIGLQ